MTEDDDFCDSGPFCRHWGDPGDCDEVCATCGHTCEQHDQGDADDSACRVNGCECDAFVDKS